MKYTELMVIFLIALVNIPSGLAADFNISAEEFGSSLLKNTISSIEISQQIIRVLLLANNSTDVQATGYMFQNLWGIIYGGIVLAGWQNQISLLVLEEIGDNPEHYNELGAGINYLGSNATTFFGDAKGTQGLARIMTGYLMALNNSSRSYYTGDTLMEAYARAIVKELYVIELFMI